MEKFSSVHIIFNPISTGNSKLMASQLYKTLTKSLKNIPIERIGTEYAGHAWLIAKDIAKSNKNPLIISSSGDGGYNEVVNGVMEAKNKRAVCAVLPAGNANDHSRTMHKEPLEVLIGKNKPKHIDLLRVTINKGRKKEVRYAHSYAGLGLTPKIGAELNKHTLNKFNEIILALRTFSEFKPFKIRRRGTVQKLDSLLFANINQMAKVLTLAPENKPDDGYFEVVTFRTTGKVNLMKKLVKAAVTNLHTTRSVRSYNFETVHKTPIQLDGEIISIPAKAKVTVRSMHKALYTLV